MINKLWNKYKEYIMYLVFGGLTTVVNYVVFFLLRMVHMESVAANTISWVAAVAFAYVTNRKWVFESKASGAKNIIREVGEFVVGRLLTLGIEDLMLFVLVDILGFNDLIIKLIASVITVVLNYVFSKFIIFRKAKENQETDKE